MDRSIIESKIIKSKNGCWEWQGSVGNNGYGTISTNSIKKLAHRVSFEVYNGKSPQGFHVCHSCDNRICVNPNHLWLGDDASNLRDMWSKGRGRNQNMFKTHCKHGHLLKGKNLKIVFRKRAKGVREARKCLKCETNNGRKAYLKKVGRDLLPPKTKCKNGHDWVKSNWYIRPDGEKNCRLCRQINRIKRIHNLRK